MYTRLCTFFGAFFQKLDEALIQQHPLRQTIEGMLSIFDALILQISSLDKELLKIANEDKVAIC